jgi:hypothetical protein
VANVVEPVVTAVLTGFVSALGTFLAINRRIDRLDEKFDRKIGALDEKFDRKFDVLMIELLRHFREGHPPNAAA